MLFVDCTPGTYGEGCAKDCSCGAGSDYCDVKIGCVCKDGWAGHRCDQDIDECTNYSILQQCKSENKQCVNLDGGYKCKCQSGSYEGVNGACTGKVKLFWKPLRGLGNYLIPKTYKII